MSFGTTTLLRYTYDPSVLRGRPGLPAGMRSFTEAVRRWLEFKSITVRSWREILLALAYFADQGIFDPSQEELAAECMISVRQLRRGLAGLRKAGLLSWSRRSRHSNHTYRIEFDPLDRTGENHVESDDPGPASPEDYGVDCRAETEPEPGSNQPHDQRSEQKCGTLVGMPARPVAIMAAHIGVGADIAGTFPPDGSEKSSGKGKRPAEDGRSSPKRARLRRAPPSGFDASGRFWVPGPRRLQ